MKVYKIFLNNLKEEVWIKKMAEDGWLIEKIGFGYSFKGVEKKDYNLVMDYRLFANNEDFEAYVTLHEDFGWKHVAGSKSSGSQYFLHPSDEEQMTLFSDKDSQKARIIRIRKMLRQVLAITLVFFITLLSSGSITIGAILNPSKLYLTPGLWDMSGNSFWSAFWLETPFALLRGILIYALPIMIIIYIVISYKVQHEYNQSLNKLD